MGYVAYSAKGAAARALVANALRSGQLRFEAKNSDGSDASTNIDMSKYRLLLPTMQQVAVELQKVQGRS